MKISKVISSSIEKSKRIVKILVFGKSDVRTAHQISPYGIDSNPIKDLPAAFSETSVKGDQIILGYIMSKQTAKPGEIRIFATDKDGAEKFFIYLHDNGECSIGGDNYHIVRYEPLDQALQSFKDKIEIQLTEIAAGIATGGGAYTPGDISIDTSQAKADKIRCL